MGICALIIAFDSFYFYKENSFTATDVFTCSTLIIYFCVSQILSYCVESLLLKNQLLDSLKRMSSLTKMPIEETPFALFSSKGVQSWFDVRFLLMRNCSPVVYATQTIFKILKLSIILLLVILVFVSKCYGTSHIHNFHRVRMGLLTAIFMIPISMESLLDAKIREETKKHSNLLSLKRDEISLIEGQTEEIVDELSKSFVLITQVIQLLKSFDYGYSINEFTKSKEKKVVSEIGILILTFSAVVLCIP
eukprot:c35546_g1_i1.p1 GENE.c35546_g1_i1~~c35546_g1_i1.p1  ORF type:complete len:249 (+),score=69.62 c35546_g1_i1:1-747(+)